MSESGATGGAGRVARPRPGPRWSPGYIHFDKISLSLGNYFVNTEEDWFKEVSRDKFCWLKHGEA